jgi:hypothetical protein
MNYCNNSLNDVDGIDLALDYPYNEAIRLPYFSDHNLVKVQIEGYDFARLSHFFLPPSDLICPHETKRKRVCYYKCNPPVGDRVYELAGNVTRVEPQTASFLLTIPPLEMGCDEAPERAAYRELQQKRWIKLLTQLDDLWWALLIEPHYINGRFEEVNELIHRFFYALLKRERIGNIMRMLSKEW